jgi:hypothetical protein
MKIADLAKMLNVILLESYVTQQRGKSVIRNARSIAERIERAHFDKWSIKHPFPSLATMTAGEDRARSPSSSPLLSWAGAASSCE